MKRKMPKRSWASGRGALSAIALLLLGSAIVRLSGPGAAIALELKEQMLDHQPSHEASAPALESDVLAPELVALLEENKARAAELDARESALDERMQTLALVEASVTERLAQLEQAELALRATMSQADKAAETDIGQLTAVYENMKPEQAAALFQKMEPSFAAGFLGRMRSDSAAAILSGLEPDLAYSISVELAGRNAHVPREPVPEQQKATE